MGRIDLRSMVELWASHPYITCEPSKCGQCLREHIKSEVSKEYLSRDIDINDATLNDRKRN